MSLYDFAKIVGITAISLILIAALLGLLTFIKFSKRKRLLHLIVAFLAVDVALIHGGIMIYMNFFM